MGVLRDRMVREISLRAFSASTQKLHLATLTDLARYHHQSPDTLDPTQVPNFLLDLTHERHLAWSSVSVAASAIRFFYTHTVKRLDLAMAMPSRRKPFSKPGERKADPANAPLVLPIVQSHRLPTGPGRHEIQDS
jgi:site-specific recombinase XerC